MTKLINWTKLELNKKQTQFTQIKLLNLSHKKTNVKDFPSV